jgi:hypothetical protein
MNAIVPPRFIRLIRVRWFFAIAIVAFMAVAAPAWAETRRALFEITLDIDHDGKADRAVLVAPEGAGFYSGDKNRFMIGPDQRVDLYIYLGGGDAPLDLSRKPTFIKSAIVVGVRQNQIFPLESTRGALIVKTAYNLFSNWAPETLTIVHRNGEFLVAGWTRDHDMKDGAQGGCAIDFLTRKGTVSKGVDGHKKPLPGRFTPVKLGAFAAGKYLEVCAR